MARKKRPIRLVTLDTETYGLTGAIKRIAIYDGKETVYGYTFGDIKPHLLKLAKDFTLHIYIHNMEFDLRKMPEIFSGNEVIWSKSFIINGKLATVECESYTLHDSFKLLPMSLKKLSAGFKVEHGKLDLWEKVQEKEPGKYEDIEDYFMRVDKDDPLYLEYLGYDVISLYEVLETVRELSGLTLKDFVKRVSTSSLSRFIFKNGYKGEPFKDPLKTKTDFDILCGYNWKYNLEVEEFLRASYVGGRVEVFKPALNHKGFHYDVNSLYPSRFDMEYPVGKPEYYNSPSIAQEYYERWKADKIGLGFVSCSVFVPLQEIPPLPVKMEKLCFPCGRIYGTWTFEELEFAEKNCGVEILEYGEVCYFANTYPVFKRFKDVFYELKEEGSRTNNDALRTFAKLLLNVAYGYTGMTRDKTQLAPYSELLDHEGVIFADEELGFIEIPSDIHAEYIQVQIASYVTSRARLVLLDALLKANKVGNVYYCDTDSIVTDEPLPEEIVHDYKLGYWKLESEPEKALFLRPKVYAEIFSKKGETKTEIKFKGVTKETQSQMNFEDYENLYKDLEEGIEKEKIVEKNRVTFRSIMYMKKNNLQAEYYEERDKKINLDTVEKRKMFYRENRTEPFFFETEEDFDNFSFKKKPEEILI